MKYKIEGRDGTKEECLRLVIPITKPHQTVIKNNLVQYYCLTQCKHMYTRFHILKNYANLSLTNPK